MTRLASTARLVAPIARDLVGVAGSVCVAGGVAMAYLPAGVVVAGAELLAVAWLLARRS